MQIKTKRVYEDYEAGDGVRILVDRIWPRGIKKESVKIDLWMKEIEPSGELRKWFAHDPAKWNDFKKKYFTELKVNKELCEELKGKAKNTLTLLYSAKDVEHNQASALKEFLDKNFKE